MAIAERTTFPAKPPENDQAALRIAGVVFLLGFVVWLATSLITGRVERWPRIYDDAYYYFGIASNVVRGYGLTMDRLNPASGFHPLWMYVLIPIFAATKWSATVTLSIIQLLQLAIWAVSTGLLFNLLRPYWGPLSAWMAALVLVLPRYLNQVMSGLEGGLAFLLMLCLIRHLLRARDDDRRSDPAIGAWLGLLMLARLDTIFVAVSLACWLLVRGWNRTTWRQELRPSVVRVFLTLWPAAAMLIPYLVFNKLYFGHAMPISGMLKSSFPHAGFYLGSLDRSQLFLFACGLWAALGRLRTVQGRLLSLTRALVIGNSLHLLYMVLFMKWGAFPWYFVSFYPAGLIGIGGTIARILETRSSKVQRVLAALWTVALSGSLVVSLLSRVGRAWYETASLEAAQWVDQHLDAGAILAMKDSGAFSFFSHRRVMNLDGLANSLEYQQALCAGRLEEFMRAKGVAYVSQHAMKETINAGYGAATMVYPCHLEGGRDSSLLLRERDEAFRGSLWHDGMLVRLVIWRLP